MPHSSIVTPHRKHVAKVTLMSLDIKTRPQARHWLRRNASHELAPAIAKAMSDAFPRRHPRQKADS
jgi:hypothetical protein